jgi:hypothetical protein
VLESRSKMQANQPTRNLQGQPTLKRLFGRNHPLSQRHISFLRQRKFRSFVQWCVLFLLLTTLPLPSLQAAPQPDIAPGCINLVENGGFELISPHWQIQTGPRPPMYTNELTFNNSLQSMRIGNVVDLPDIESVSEVRYVPIQFPLNATRIILRFRYQPRYDAAPGADLQQVDLYYEQIDQLALSLLNTQENDPTWKLVEKDLTQFRGQLIGLRFRVRNDGAQGRSWMYIDNVEIEFCSDTPITPTHTPQATATSTPTLLAAPSNTPTATDSPGWPTATSTPVGTTVWPTLPPPPPGCINLLDNGSFEEHRYWYFGEDPIPPRYVNEPVRSGGRAVLLGNPPGGGPSVETYSSIRQRVTLPYDANFIELRWWQLPYSQEGNLPYAGPYDDRQEVILLTPDLTVIDILARERSNAGSWQQRSIDLTDYRGKRLYIYFNVFNHADDARTWMILDDVELWACGAAVYSESEAEAADFYPPAEEIDPAQLPFDQPAALAAPAATLAPFPSPTLPPPTALPSSTPVAVAPAATTTGAVGAVVAILTTPTTDEAEDLLRSPSISFSTSGQDSRPWWQRQFGTLSILCAIPILILLIIVLLIQIRRVSRASSRP